MFPGVPKTGLSFTKVLGGINKTLNVANQIIPLYMQAKPMITNARNAFSVAKEFMTAHPQTQQKQNITTKPISKIEPKKEDIKSLPTSNNPVFFL